MFGPLIVKPAKSKGDNTGAWRVKSRPKFLQEKCIGCRLCVMVCPENCITGKEKNTFNFDPNFCKGCGLCSRICPKSDIIMVDESPEGEKKK